jgi:alkaline phosphatase D
LEVALRSTITRRRLLAASGALAVNALPLPSLSRAGSRPGVSHGVQSGDVEMTSGVVWARSDRPARLLIEVATRESFADALRLPPIDALPAADFTAKRLIENLAPGQTIFYRLRFADLSDVNALGEAMTGRFRTPPMDGRAIRFVWSADTAGQGFGINAQDGGMKTYAAMAMHDPDFFLHSGDTVYCDGPIKPEIKTSQGLWKNLVAEGVEKVAETLGEFRGRFKYNLLDRNLLAFNAQIPTFCQWDDHEVLDNWSSAKDLRADPRYTEKSIASLSRRARQAFHEMMPIRSRLDDPGRIYRKIAYGRLLDIFFLDLRSYRGPNGSARETNVTPQSRILGAAQLGWLKRALKASQATWKVIASDMPIGLIVWDDWKAKTGAEAVANGDHGPPSGRELEFAELLAFIKRAGIANVVWLTADVHYTAAHHYTPDKAQFQDFEPFWEFVSGPLHAGTFGPNALDMTFGPEVRFMKAPKPEQGQNLPPSAGLQFFGIVDIDDKSRQMTVRLMDRGNAELYRVTLDPQA